MIRVIRATRAVAVLSVALLGLWGCAQGPNAAAQAERIKSLEAKITRLEADFRAAAGSRDQLRQQLAQAEEHIQRLQVVVKERDELKIQVKLRMSERDQLAAQYETFRKSIKDLLGQAEASVQRLPTGDPVTVTVTAGPRAKAEDGPALSQN
jgi:septal ring factor EnvC (AmiA/AmiB activator)